MRSGMSGYTDNISTVVGVKEAFDVARGRALLRTMILSRRLNPRLNVRATTALTALGELIVAANTTRIVPLKIGVVESGQSTGIEMSCDIETCNDDGTLIESYHQLRRVTDDLDIQNTAAAMRITLRVWDGD